MARIDALFDELIAAGGSDLHLAVGYPPHDAPARRAQRRCARRRSTPPRWTALLFEITTPEQKRTILETLDLDFAYAYGRQGPLPRQLLLQDHRARGRLPHDPEQGPDARRPRTARPRSASSPSAAPASCS